MILEATFIILGTMMTVLYLAMIFTMDRSFESRLLQLIVTILAVAFDLAGGLYLAAGLGGFFALVQLGYLIAGRINPRT